jgi:hypothetical protein
VTHGVEASTGVRHASDERALVAATSVETGRFAPDEQSVDRDDLIRLVDQLSAIDQGYVEVRRVDDDFPSLLVGFRKGLAAVHCMWGPESMALLTGDGSVAGSELVEVLVMDDLVPFTGEYLVESARARDVLLKFADGADPRSLGEWHDL